MGIKTLDTLSKNARKHGMRGRIPEMQEILNAAAAKDHPYIPFVDAKSKKARTRRTVRSVLERIVADKPKKITPEALRLVVHENTHHDSYDTICDLAEQHDGILKYLPHRTISPDTHLGFSTRQIQRRPTLDQNAGAFMHGLRTGEFPVFATGPYRSGEEMNKKLRGTRLRDMLTTGISAGEMGVYCDALFPGLEKLYEVTRDAALMKDIGTAGIWNRLNLVACKNVLRHQGENPMVWMHHELHPKPHGGFYTLVADLRYNTTTYFSTSDSDLAVETRYNLFRGFVVGAVGDFPYAKYDTRKSYLAIYIGIGDIEQIATKGTEERNTYSAIIGELSRNPGFLLEATQHFVPELWAKGIYKSDYERMVECTGREVTLHIPELQYANPVLFDPIPAAMFEQA